MKHGSVIGFALPIILAMSGCKTATQESDTKSLGEYSSAGKCSSGMFRVTCKGYRVVYASDYAIKTNQVCHDISLLPQKVSVFRSLDHKKQSSAGSICVVDPKRIKSIDLIAVESGESTRSIVTAKPIPLCTGTRFEVLTNQNKIMVNGRELSSSESFPSKELTRSKRYSKISCVDGGQSKKTRTRGMNPPAEDITPPEIISLKLEPSIIEEPTKGRLIIEAKDDMSGIDHTTCQELVAQTDFKIPVCENLNKIEENKYSIDFTVGPYAPNFKFYLKHFTLRDKAGNTLHLAYDKYIDAVNYIETTIKVPTLQVKTQNPDTTKPNLTRVVFDNPVVEAGSDLRTIITATDDLSGIKLDLFALHLFPEGTQSSQISIKGKLKSLGNNRYMNTYNIPKEAESGKYSIFMLVISDNAGNFYNLPTIGSDKEYPLVEIKQTTPPKSSIEKISFSSNKVAYGSPAQLTLQSSKPFSQESVIIASFKSIYSTDSVLHDFELMGKPENLTNDNYAFTMDWTMPDSSIGGKYRLTSIQTFENFAMLTLWDAEKDATGSGQIYINVSNPNMVKLLSVSPTRLKIGERATLMVEPREDISNVRMMCVSYKSSQSKFTNCGNLKKESDNRYSIIFSAKNDESNDREIKVGEYQISEIRLGKEDDYKTAWIQKSGEKPESGIEETKIELTN